MRTLSLLAISLPLALSLSASACAVDPAAGAPASCEGGKCDSFVTSVDAWVVDHADLVTAAIGDKYAGNVSDLGVRLDLDSVQCLEDAANDVFGVCIVHGDYGHLNTDAAWTIAIPELDREATFEVTQVFIEQ